MSTNKSFNKRQTARLPSELQAADAAAVSAYLKHDTSGSVNTKKPTGASSKTPSLVKVDPNELNYMKHADKLQKIMS